MAPRPRPPVANRTFRNPPPPEWSFWEPVEPVITAEFQTGVLLPLSEADLPKSEGEAGGALLNEDERRMLQRQGFVVLATRGASGIGSFYADLHEKHAPHVITFDSLFLVTHAALSSALAETDAAFLRPSLESTIRGLLRQEESAKLTAPSELVRPLKLCANVLEMSLALSSPSFAPRQENANAVQRELAFVRAHDGVHESPILGVPFDYAAFGASDVSLPSAFHAYTWLSRAPFFLAADTELEGSPIRILSARAHARAAMLLTHFLMKTPDRATHDAWHEFVKMMAFEVGDSDDLLPDRFAEIADNAAIDLKSTESIANVAKVDRLRHLALDTRGNELFDGAGAPLRTLPKGGTFSPLRGALSVRLFAGGAPLDSEVLQSLVFPMLGKTVREPAPATSRKGYRVFPTALDLAAWLGSREARDVLTQIGADSFEGFDAAFDKVVRRRPQESSAALHRSLHMSLLDVVHAYLEPSLAEPESMKSEEWRTRKLESALSAWTLLRHMHRPFERTQALPPTKEMPEEKGEGAVKTFIEPHPEAIGRLAATLKQAEKGLAALGHLDAASAAIANLREAESIAFVAYRASTRLANGESLTAEEQADVDQLDERLRRFEARLGKGVVDSRVVTAVHRELGTNSTLLEATGTLETVVVAMRDPESGKTILVQGAHLPHYEFVTGAARAPTDIEFRQQLSEGSPPKRDPCVSTYRSDPLIR